MNRETYRRAFDDIPFSDDFEKRTIKLLQDRARNQEKEKTTMTFSKHRKLAVTLAAAVAALALSVSAAVLWLSPAQVAEEIDDPLLAQAFDGDEALVLNETAQAGEYTVTLGGLVSGTGISNWCGDVEESRTYAVVSVARTDGAPLTDENYDVSASGTFTITPLAEGYERVHSGWQLRLLPREWSGLLPAGHAGYPAVCGPYRVSGGVSGLCAFL